VTDTDRATLIRHLLQGQYSSPVRIVAFNTAEGGWHDVTTAPQHQHGEDNCT
jgi:hypothetical protein